MKFNYCNVKLLALMKAFRCLEIRQLYLLMAIFSILSISCGKVINQKKNQDNLIKNVSFLMMENQCNNKMATESNIAKSIRELYQNTVQNSPQLFVSIVPRLYNHESQLSYVEKIWSNKSFALKLELVKTYIEFFDDLKKELVYYEISNDNPNIMCSLKVGAGVPDDYFAQLAQNSCLFN